MLTQSKLVGHIAARRPRHTPPKLSGGLPGLGHTAEFVRNTIGLLERAYKECGEMAQFRLVGKKMVLVTGPALQEQVFRMPDEVLSPNAAYKMMVPVFGRGVAYDCEPARMMEQLHMLLPALQGKRMRTYSRIVADEVELSIAEWGHQGVFDLYEYAQSLTNFTSSHCLLGAEFRQEMNTEFARVYHDLERGIIPIGYLHPNLPIPAFRRRDRARARLGEMVSQIVDARHKSGHVGDDFLQTLMESHYQDGSRLSDHEITGLLVAAMFAGHHTSSVTTAWTLLELLRYPHFLRQVVDEIDSAFSEHNEVTFEMLRELPRTEAAIKEALRLHPPLFMLLRVALQDCKIGGYDVAKGTWLVVSPHVAHRLDSVFADAETYDLGRYDADRAEDQTPFAYIAFGGGRHKCMGNAFAILQIKAIFAKLLQRYEFALFGDQIEADFRGLVIGPRSPCRVRYRYRS